ncbi:MAG: hypothetical protein ACKPKO_29520, partial [Candidatus Fonsibacter sp.]
MVDLVNVPTECVPYVVHNTQMVNSTSIIQRGLIPGGGGMTSAVYSQLSAFHLMDRRLQDSSRARTTDAIIVYNVEAVKSMLMVAMSGILVTRKTLPSTAIGRIWIRRNVPFKGKYGKRTSVRARVTMADTRASGIRITGWLGAQHPGHSNVFRQI